MRVWRAVFLFVLFLVSSFVQAAGTPGRYDPPVALVGATLHNPGAAPIENAVVVITDGAITAVAAGTDPPPEALPIDAGGLHVYPGFIDAHSYLGIPDVQRTEQDRHRLEDENPDPRQGPLPVTRRANRRGIRPQVRARDIYALDTEPMRGHHRLGFATVLAAPRSGIWAGFGSLIDVTDAPLRRAVVQADLTQHAAFDTGEPGKYPQTLLGIIASMRQFAHDTKWYMDMKAYAAGHADRMIRLPVDPALEAMTRVVKNGVPVVFQADTEQDILRALRLSRELGFRVIISGGREAYKVVDALKQAQVPVLVGLKFDPEPEYGRKKPAAPKTAEPPEPGEPEAHAAAPDEAVRSEAKKTKPIYETLKVRADKRRIWQEQVDNLATLIRAGVPAAVCSYELDTPATLIKNLRRAMESGLSADDALAALTINPATIFGVQDRLGSVAAGRMANLAVMTAPLEDEDAKVKWMFVEGKQFIVQAAEPHPGKTDRADEAAPGDAEKSTAKADTPNATDAGRSGIPATETGPEQQEDEGPLFAAETEADRKPRIHTGGDVMIRGATVLPISGDTIPNASVLIRDGRIEAVGRDLVPPVDVLVIDAKGLYVMPGMIDCHSHMGIDAVNEAPLSISAEVRIADVINPRQVAIYRALAGGVTTIHTMHGSANPIGGQNVILKLRYGKSPDEMVMRDTPRTIKFALGENVTQSNWQEARGKRFPNSRMGVESTLRQALVAADAYRKQRKAHADAVAAGAGALPLRRDFRLEALADVLDGKLWVHCHGYRADEYLRLMAVAEDFGFRIAVLQHVLEGYRIAPEIARHGCGASTFSNDWAYKLEAYNAVAYNAAFLTRRGIVTSVNSDSANTIRFMNTEAGKSVRWGGLTDIEALRLVTLNPAMQLGIADRVGSIEPGKDGDIAIFNGHPLDSFSKCVMTLVDGEVYFENRSPGRAAPVHPIRRAPQKLAPVETGPAYAITGATVHPIRSAAIPNAIVVIRDGRIEAVGADAVIPPDAVRINANGAHVYPGLIDAGSVLGLSEILMLPQTRDHSDIATIEPELWTGSAVNPFSAHIRVARSAGITTALTIPTGSRIGGRDTIIDLDGWSAPEMIRKPTFALHMRVPSLPVKLPDDEEKKKEMTEKHRSDTRRIDEFLRRAKQYADRRAVGDDTLPRDLRMEAMIPYVRGEAPVVFSANSYKQILDTLDFAGKYQLRCIIRGGREAWKCAERLAAERIPVIISTVISYPAGDYEPFDSVFSNAAVLDKAGVRFCFASASAAEAFNLPIYAGMAVAYGLDPGHAVRALTLGAAEILGIDDQVGSLEPGKTANLIVCSDSPIQVTAGVTYMFIRGHPVALTSRQTENLARFEHRPAPVLPPAPDLVGPPALSLH